MSPQRRSAATLVVLSITPFGRTGPWKDRPWSEFTLQAASGSVLTRGIPGGDLGKIGLDLAPSNPDIVYAIVEAKDGSAVARERFGRDQQAGKRSHRGDEQMTRTTS